MIYGYCRVSTSHQKITRQITNIREMYPKANLIKEFYTGTTQSRPLWEKMVSQLTSGDTVVFDSVSRMSKHIASILPMLNTPSSLSVRSATLLWKI